MKIRIIEHPKCGRTWLYNMMNIIISHDKLAIKRLDRAHNNTSLLNRENKYKKRQYLDIHKKLNYIIFLIRNPKDVINSFYFWATVRGNYFSGSMSQFIKSKYGIEYLLKFYRDWDKIHNENNNIIPIYYEDLKQNTKETLVNLFDKIGFNVSDKALNKAIKQTSFNKMRKQEGKFNNSAKFRKGIIGDHKNNFTKKDIKYCNDLIKKYKCGFIREDYL